MIRVIRLKLAFWFIVLGIYIMPNDKAAELREWFEDGMPDTARAAITDS